MLHADSSDLPSLAIGGARTMDITSCGNGYRRSPLRTDEPKPSSLAPYGLLSSLNFSHFSFAVWLVLVYNERTERG
jgi:hypothetical protein